ncbi:MAG TPA: M14 family metallopeptidase [Gemmatimonadales bacterium]|nr:M14 family metallopeptidase [Gemmatimonadales bacterium]
MRKPILLLAAAALVAAPLAAQSTRPERTNARETSTYADVVGFVDSLQHLGAGIRVGILGKSPQGRPIPYVIAARPMVYSPSEARRTGKPIIYLQGNIHSGEVEGKEVVQMMLRDLTLGSLKPLLDSIVLIAVPIYNTDGNETFGPGERNRPDQNGPAIVGGSENGQGLNLNRDYFKMEAPETRGSMALLTRWDPDLFVDLHTTDGSYHGYVLTYSPGLNPNSNPLNDYGRDTFLPTLRARMESRHHEKVFPYGNFRNQDPDSLVLGWETYEPGPRFGTNLFGLRGRMALLSEAYSHADFQTRITATYNFVHEILSLAAEQVATIHRLVVESDHYRPDSVTVRSQYAKPKMEDVIAEVTKPAGQGSSGYSRRVQTGVFKTIRMPVYDQFAPARREAMPVNYVLPAEWSHLADLLRRQGIIVNQLSEPWLGPVEHFMVDSVTAQMRPFQGHRLVTVDGSWKAAARDSLPAGTYLVNTDQPLGALAAYLLEPASEDGFVTWGLLDRAIQRRRPYPLTRTRVPVHAVMRQVP